MQIVYSLKEIRLFLYNKYFLNLNLGKHLSNLIYELTVLIFKTFKICHYLL